MNFTNIYFFQDLNICIAIICIFAKNQIYYIRFDYLNQY